MHLLVIKYDVYNLESEHTHYKKPKNSDLIVTVLDETRDLCFEKVCDKIIKIFGTFSKVNISEIIVDTETDKTLIDVLSPCGYKYDL